MSCLEIQKSGEDYLETILVLDKKTGYVRSIDVAVEMGFSKPSVSRAISILKENGLVTVSEDGQLKLTKAGKKKAEDVYQRHLTILKFFTDKLGVNPVTAEEDACKVEHVISEETYQRLKAFIDN